MVGNHPALSATPTSWGHLQSLAHAVAEGTIDGFFSRKAAFLRLPSTLPGGHTAVVLAHDGGVTITTEEKRPVLLPFLGVSSRNPPADVLPPLPQPWGRGLALGPAAPSTPADVWLIASFAGDLVGFPTLPANSGDARAWLARLLPADAVLSLENAFPAAQIPVGHLFRNALIINREGPSPVRRRIRRLVAMAGACGLIVLLSLAGWLPFWCSTLALLIGLFIARYHSSFWPVLPDDPARP